MSGMKSAVFQFVMIMALISLSGCAKIASGKTQALPVNSKPSGATVIVNGVRYRAPVTIRLDRRRPSHEIKAEMDGYAAQTILLKKGMNGWFVGNAVFGGLVGVVVDIATGAVCKFYPTRLDFQLQKVSANGSGL